MRRESTRRPAIIRVVTWLTPVLAVAMLAGIYMEQRARAVDPSEVEAHHARAARIAEALPLDLGPWRGTEGEVISAAVSLLNPNFILSRQYRNEETGEAASFLLVHCKDARDLVGHYPPNCYPAHGWSQNGAKHIDWHLGGMHLTGMQYRFSYERPRGTSRMVVDNFIIMPDGRIMRTVDGVYAAAADYTTHFYGAAQVQLVTSVEMTEQRRREVFRRIVGANLDVIETLRSGIETDARSNNDGPAR